MQLSAAVVNIYRYEMIIQAKKLFEEELAHGFISSKELERKLMEVVTHCEKGLKARSGGKGRIEIPVAVVTKDKDFEVPHRS